MKIFKSFLLISFMLLSPLAAEESDAAAKCDQAYDACLEKCEKAEDGAEQCFSTCETTYDKCLAEANK